MVYETRRPNELRRPRNRSYAWMGVVVLCLILLAVLMGALGFQGPRVFDASVAWLIGICLFALAVGVLYLLFTIRTAMREIREQALALARLEVQRQRVEAMQNFPGEKRPSPSTHNSYGTRPATVFPAHDVGHAVVTGPTVVPGEVVDRPSRPVGVLEGIGPTYERRLSGAGIETLSDLRDASEPEIAQIAGVRPPTPHHWKAMANLMILDGVNAQAAELLARAGCDNLRDVASRDAFELHGTLRAINEEHERRIYPQPLRLEDVRAWVLAARLGRRRDRGYGRPFEGGYGAGATA